MVLGFLFKGEERRYKRYLENKVKEILFFEENFKNLSKEDLKNKTLELKKRFEEGVKKEKELKEKSKIELTEVKKEGDTEKTKQARIKLNDSHKNYIKKEKKVLDELLSEAFALVKVACKLLVGSSWEVRGKMQEWNMVPFDVQLMGGIVLHDGKIAEMKTGEGKTLVCTLPLYLHALTGRGVHLVTVNEYLASRDSEWMGGLFEALGLSCGVIKHEMDSERRKEEYAKDITYTTNNELGFDYLRDNMSTKPENIVQRDLAYCVVDEVDSILIDEARTPLIISSPGEEAGDKYVKYGRLIKNLNNSHYTIDEKQKTAVLTDEGIKKMEELLGVQNIYTDAGVKEVHHIEQALKANIIFQKDKDYVVKDDEIIIVDEFTGRLMPGRRYSEGLHQAIEAKEGVTVQRESKTLATITFQNFFRLYDTLSGMTGTAKTEEEEFQKIYGLDVEVIPTRLRVARIDKPDAIFRSIHGKFTAITKIVKEKYEKGQPVLIGTVSIEKSETLSEYFRKSGIPHNVLNAKHHEKEAEIIASAGQKGSVTIATNMAGRGTDIKITDEVKSLGGLCVIGSERHESRRIDNQLRGRSGRQGDNGESQFFVSMEDDLMRIFGGDRIKSVMAMLNMPEDMPIENKMISGSLEKAQTRVEAHHFDMRKHVVEYDNIMNKHREILYSRRRDLLFDEDPSGTIKEFFKRFIQNLVNIHTFGKNRIDYEIDSISERIVALTGKNKSEIFEIIRGLETDEIIEVLNKLMTEFYESKWEKVPKEEKNRIEKMISLQVIDVLWMQHIDDMVKLREHVAYRGYAQRDPLGEYRSEGFSSFEKLLSNIENGVVQTLCQIELVPKMDIKEETPKMKTNDDKIEEGLDTGEFDTNKLETGRNDPCPCGSGKKYKKCCGN